MLWNPTSQTMRRAGFHHLQHGKPAGGAMKGLVGRLSIAVVVLLYVLFRSSSSGGSRSAYCSEFNVELWRSATSGDWRPSLAPHSEWPRMLFFSFSQSNLIVQILV